ncbi:hypothetical protein Pen02_47820 [Plantactinospora endophytica]|uniref:Integral membrane protein n=2 Tax=Plantactinospora endophytica TaxID=673535 RepID=A0ABQ4E566_9ACTN|nr:hypothetical protein Pen02_47820 [Plantactinospora endophytica]
MTPAGRGAAGRRHPGAAHGTRAAHVSRGVDHQAAGDPHEWAPHEIVPRPGWSDRLAYWPAMVLSRRWATFLILVGVWTWVIWPRFAVAIWNDARAWSTGEIGQGSPTSFLWVHALLIGASLAIGTTVGVLGVRAWLAGRRQRS